MAQLSKFSNALRSCKNVKGKWFYSIMLVSIIQIFYLQNIHFALLRLSFSVRFELEPGGLVIEYYGDKAIKK